MTVIDAAGLDYKELNDLIREGKEDITLINCLGQRFIASGAEKLHLVIKGIPGNALGAYLDGAVIDVLGNAQDAVGDTMNDGAIVIHGNIGDAAGYAMRGGKIFVKNNAGYRAGIHMKAYKDKVPVMVIGGCAGSFLGEYQAGGKIAVLGLESNGKKIVGNFPCTGMHGGMMFLRGKCEGVAFPAKVHVKTASDTDISEIYNEIHEFCTLFEKDEKEIISSPFTLITPDTKNPYKQMYVAN